MAVDPDQLQIVLYPHPVLRARARPVEAVTDEVRAVARKMLQLMHEAPGVGLAAPQVGLSWRLFVANDSGEPDDDRVFINPVLMDPGPEIEDHEEGCLSLPEITGQIRRPRTITVEALDEQGQAFRMTSSDLAARIWQHETDHLDGVLIIDRMPPIDRMANRRLLKELEQACQR